jgi:hypothetical protein
VFKARPDSPLSNCCSRPAEEDPEGNWSFVSEQMQVSCRPCKPAYAVDELIDMIVLVRNVSDTNRYALFPGAGPPLFQISLTDEGNQPVSELNPSSPCFARKPKNPFRPNESLGPFNQIMVPFHIEPRTQLAAILPLHQFYDLSRPGRYFVNVGIPVPRLDRSGTNELMSGNAMFQILAGPGTNGPLLVPTNLTARTGQPLPPADARPPPATTAIPADARANVRPTIQPEVQRSPETPSVLPAPPDQAAGERTGLLTPRNVAFGSSLAGLVLLGGLGLWLLRRRKA